MSLRKHQNQKKFRDSYDGIFGKKDNYKYTDIDEEQCKSRKKKRSYGYIPVENIKVY